MKEILDKKFVFVQPLYKKAKKIKDKTKIQSFVIDIDRNINLKGHERQNVEDDTNISKSVYFKRPKVFPFIDKFRDIKTKDTDMSVKSSKNGNSGIYSEKSKPNQSIKSEKSSISALLKNLNCVPDGWLRFYPENKEVNETICSVIIRCCCCQLGIITFLVLWTLAATFIIHSIEGPHELKLSIEYEEKQNQLVIDLATELRQITPISPKWLQTIEKRLQEERELTIAALGRGVKLEPGFFWTLCGTFLFNIYVMTALGFGAPVPHTIAGRTAALIYALFAIPLHLTLMLNLSSYIVYHVEVLQKKIYEKVDKFYKSEKENSSETDKQSRHCRRNGTGKVVLRAIIKLLSTISVCRGIPLTIILYFTIGALVFGLLRNKQSIDIVLFPLEFTTSGGLEQINEHVRFFYGLYVEGAIILLACTMATLRRCSSCHTETFITKYRLFHIQN